jgi:hypothetical protein
MIRVVRYPITFLFETKEYNSDFLTLNFLDSGIM